MAVSALTRTFGGTTMEITEAKYDELVRHSEQFRILKNYIRLETTLTKSEIVNLINAMEMEANDERNES